MAPLGAITVALALTATLLLGGSSAFAGVAVGNDGNSHDSIWRVSDVGLYMDNQSLLELPGAVDAVIAAIDTWRAVDTRLPQVWPILGTVDELGYHAGQDNKNTIRYAAQGEPLANGALAITLVSYDSEKLTILDADIVINGIYQFANNGEYCGQRAADGDNSAYDLGDVIAHEFGHWLGLPDDPDDPTAIMYPYFDPGEVRRKSPSANDQQALTNLYASDAQDSKPSAACSVSVVPNRSRCAPDIWAVFGIVGTLQLFRRRLGATNLLSRRMQMAKGPQARDNG